MRSLIALMLAGVAGVLAGCVYTGFYEADGRTVTSPYSDSPEPHKIYFPYVLKYPDETDYFFPVTDGPQRSDLNLAAMGCVIESDGTFYVIAQVRNQGSSVVPAIPFFTGFMGAFRVAAVVTTAGGEREQVDAVQVTAMPVTASSDLALGPTRARARDVVAIDVVADPDRVVPDPMRDNNVLSWRGTMQGDNPTCTVVR